MNERRKIGKRIAVEARISSESRVLTMRTEKRAGFAGIPEVALLTLLSAGRVRVGR